MSLLSIFNRTKLVSSTPKPAMQTQATKQSVTVHSGPAGGTAKDVQEVRENPQLFLHPNDSLAKLAALSRGKTEKEKPQYRVFEPPSNGWELDEFNLKYAIPKCLGDAGPGKSFFAQGVWGLANQVVTKSFLLALMAEALNDGLGELCPKDWQEGLTEDSALWCRTQDAGIAVSLEAAFVAVASGQAEAAQAIRQGQTPPTLRGMNEREGERQQVHLACHAIFKEISLRSAAKMQKVCQRLRGAGIRLVEKQVANEEAFATENETEFRSSNKLIQMIHFCVLDRLGNGGWMVPWWGQVHLGCSLPPESDPYGCGIDWFPPSPEYVRAKKIAMARLRASMVPTSRNKARYFQNMTKPGELEKLL